jgi:hypothetical protein
LFLTFSGGSGSLFNFNWWRFQLVSAIGKISVQHHSNELTFLSKNANLISFTYSTPENFSGRNLKMTVSDLQGRLVASQSCEYKTSGITSFSFDRKKLRSGMYVINISADNKVLIKSTYLMR